MQNSIFLSLDIHYLKSQCSFLISGSFEVGNLIPCRHWSELCGMSYFLANLVICCLLLGMRISLQIDFFYTELSFCGANVVVLQGFKQNPDILRWRSPQVHTRIRLNP